MSLAMNQHAEFEELFSDPGALTYIYDDATNIAIWNRDLPSDLLHFSQRLSREASNFQCRIMGDLAALKRGLQRELPDIENKSAFIEDALLLADMFCELLDTRNVGLRCAVLHKAMCPKFHVDRVPARLVTTYWGEGTEWVENAHVTREERNIQVNADAPVEHLLCGQVALLKGEMWGGNEGRGLVHRSPPASIESPRVVFTLDCL